MDSLSYLRKSWKKLESLATNGAAQYRGGRHCVLTLASPAPAPHTPLMKDSTRDPQLGDKNRSTPDPKPGLDPE